MTVEEAVEVILRGSPWVNCAKCNGNGHTELTPSPHVHAVDLCTACDGARAFLRSEYREACETLGRPCPENHLRLVLRDIQSSVNGSKCVVAQELHLVDLHTGTAMVLPNSAKLRHLDEVGCRPPTNRALNTPEPSILEPWI